MARGRKPRTWVKIDCNGILRGSINWILTLEEQATWVKMIAYSEVCGGRPGYIEDNDGNGLPREFLSYELHCPMEILASTIEKMVKNGSIEVNGTGSIFLVHFADYQFSEYERQKPYREMAKRERQGKKVNKICPECKHQAYTDEVYCPECAEKGEQVVFKRDYGKQRYGGIVKR